MRKGSTVQENTLNAHPQGVNYPQFPLTVPLSFVFFGLSETRAAEETPRSGISGASMVTFTNGWAFKRGDLTDLE